ncbi:paralemmin-1-like isoform X2 [Perca fluviatilis]|nr:paralemmin-1-like isoform X2 [Perca fluviatilis]
MTQRMSYESGQEGRSVLGMLAVQVERDPKTGATSVRSVAPVSPVPSGAPTAAATVYDDGRKSIRAVGGSGSQPSNEELGQILSIVDGVGMKALLDEVTKVDADRHPEGNVSSSARNATAKEDRSQLDSSGSYDLEAGLGIQDWAADDRSMPVVRDLAGEVDNVEDLSLDEGPVTLVFLGYADGDGGDGRDYDDDEGMLTAERVIITGEGEECVVGPEPSPEAGRKEPQEFQDVPLDGNGAGVKVPGQEGDRSANKRKTCQCCSVM